MDKIRIITDSHSSISQATARELGILVLPMPFYIDGTCYYEDTTLTRQAFFEKLAAGADITTSQPSPQSVMALWDQALADCDQVLYLPLSSGLSGSCATAAAFAEEEPYAGRVFVVDHGRVASPLHRTVLDALELVKEGYSAQRIKEILEGERDHMRIYIAVNTLEYLKKGGRISAATAMVGTLLGIKPVLRLQTGILESYQKCRGMAAAKKLMIQSLQEDLETTFHEEMARGEVSLLAAGSADDEETAAWLEEIRQTFPGMELLYDPLSLGICCHTGEGALGIGCSLRPKR